MSLSRKPSPSTPVDEIKVQIVRTWKGNQKESGNEIDMVLLNSSGTRIHTTIDEAFSKWISDLGDGNINKSKGGETKVDISEDVLISECKDPIKTMMKEVYGETFKQQSNNPDFYQERAILCQTNDVVDQINNYMLSQLPGEEKESSSVDRICPSNSSPSDDMLYPTEILNMIKVSGFPDHKLRLKVGAPVMLLKDIDPKGGLCNGTRLQITRLDNFVLEVRVLNGNNNGKKVLIPRMPTYPTDANFPIKMQRRQFPLKLAFAMTINQSQGQTLSKVGLFLERRMFSHKQMYVAISKVKCNAGLKICITDKDGKSQEETENVVFKEVCQNI